MRHQLNSKEFEDLYKIETKNTKIKVIAFTLFDIKIDDITLSVQHYLYMQTYKQKDGSEN